MNEHDEETGQAPSIRDGSLIGVRGRCCKFAGAGPLPAGAGCALGGAAAAQTRASSATFTTAAGAGKPECTPTAERRRSAIHQAAPDGWEPGDAKRSRRDGLQNLDDGQLRGGAGAGEEP